MPSPIMKVVERMWSVMTRSEMSVFSSFLYSTPAMRQMCFMMFCTVSTSKRLPTFCMTQARRSRPMPVSMFGFGMRV